MLYSCMSWFPIYKLYVLICIKHIWSLNIYLYVSISKYLYNCSTCSCTYYKLCSINKIKHIKISLSDAVHIFECNQLFLIKQQFTNAHINIIYHVQPINKNYQHFGICHQIINHSYTLVKRFVKQTIPTLHLSIITI